MLIQIPMRVPGVSQPGLLTSQRPEMEQSLFASQRTTFSGFKKSVGEGFGPLIQMYPHPVQAALISMKPEPIHSVCSDGAQAGTPPLQRHPKLPPALTDFWCPQRNKVRARQRFSAQLFPE